MFFIPDASLTSLTWYGMIQVNFNEPLSMIQRLVEDLEYADILHTAAECKTTVEEMCYVAGFTIGAYASTAVRNTKPFNPLLGETYEFDRSDDLGWRALCEQVRTLLKFHLPFTLPDVCYLLT